MNEMSINSKEYWEKRFQSGDWDSYEGGKQSAFFSELAVKAFPEWLSNQLSKNSWSIVDLGCAEGSGTAVLARFFPRCSLTGMDFSISAIESAKKRFPYCKFEVADITGELAESDVVFCSNVLEHMKNPYDHLEKMVSMAKHHAIFMVPLHDAEDIAEHFFVFGEEFFPLKIGKHNLSYFRVLDCARENSPYWPGEQLLLIYSDANTYPQETRFLSELSSNDEYILLKKQMKKVQEELMQQLAVLSNQASNLETKLEVAAQALQAEKDAAAQALQAQKEANRTLELKLADIQHKQERVVAALRDDSMELEQNIQKKDREIEQLKRQLAEIDGATAAELESRLCLLRENRDVLTQVLNTCNVLLRSRLFRLVHMFSRWKYQGNNDSKKERKAFRRWLYTRFFHKTPDSDHRYNPLYQIITPLTTCRDRLDAFVYQTEIGASSNQKSTPVSHQVQNTISADTSTVKPVCNCLSERYEKYDVIVFSVIDYDFRYQRPQQIADHFAREGHRVFYVNANFKPEGTVEIRQKKSNLWLVTLSNRMHTAVYSTVFEDAGIDLNKTLDEFVTEQGIRDALLIADYPNWVSGMLYLKNRYGFKLATDYMDDYSGFDNAEEEFIERACIKLLENSDVVVPSSNYLAEIAEKYNDNIEVIRNGTEFGHFYSAYKMLKTTHKKVIGYYGAIAHWFDADKIKYLSDYFPDAEIILIGAVTAGEKVLSKLPNVKLLGEKPYKELPQYLRDFDVCLIPFDASTNLIKATNPVKFYEYLSAGKKVVATEIPELEPFRDQYVYLANDDEKFAKYVEMCLNGTDTLASPDECMEFAKQNDWSVRVAQFSAATQKQFPKISVIVLCYNQLDYTKQCVESILQNTAYPNYELVLVDNNSTDNTAEWLQEIEKASDKIKIILNKENRGFAGGNNDGIRASDGEYIVLLNNDTLVTRGWLSGLVKRFVADETVGIVGPITNSIGNEAMVQLGYSNVKQMPDLAYAYTARHMDENYPHDGCLAMFCVMFSRKLTEKIGLLDENYGVGMFEDDDYSVAAAKAGYKVIMAEDVFVHHFGSVSFKKLEDEKYRKLFEHNKAYFEKKWNTKWKMHKYRPGIVI